MGQNIFGALILLYLIFSVGTVKWAVHHAKSKEKNVKLWSWSIASLMFLIIPISGTYCFFYVVSEFNEKNIAMATLYGENYEKSNNPASPFTPIPDQVFTDALNAKFPVGTEVHHLVDFVSKLGGTCHDNHKDNSLDKTLYCSITEEATICVSHTLELEVIVRDSGIKRIQASHRHELC